MLDELVNWLQYNFWFSTACLAAGVIVVSPFLLSRSFRKRFSRSDVDIEHIGFAALVVAIIAIALYNRLGATGGA